MKTIKMIADELNVTKQTIVNNAKNLNIIFEKKNGINYINEEDYLKIVNKINKKERVFVNVNNDEEKMQEHNKEEKKEFLKESSKNNFVDEEKLKLKINELEKQIENFKVRLEKDSTYIETLTEQLNQQNSNVNTLNRLLENQQILALESNKKIQSLENALEKARQLNYSSDNNEYDSKFEKDKTVMSRNKDDNNHIQEEKISKKGFWGRLFGN